jgi:cell cycle checkpoint protein
MYKPDFFERLKNGKEALDGVRDVQDWLTKARRLESKPTALSNNLASQDTVSVVGGWSKNDVALELGAVLKAREQLGWQLNCPLCVGTDEIGSEVCSSIVS